MNACRRRDEVTQALRAGHWPQGCATDLREHVAECARCREEVHLLQAFAASRATAMQMASPQGAELLWWKAQLRRRHNAMERLERPGLAISTATIAASVVVLLIAMAAVWKHVEWQSWVMASSLVESNVWIAISLGAVLVAFAAVAVAVGLVKESR